MTVHVRRGALARGGFLSGDASTKSDVVCVPGRGKCACVVRYAAPARALRHFRGFSSMCLALCRGWLMAQGQVLAISLAGSRPGFLLAAWYKLQGFGLGTAALPIGDSTNANI